MYFKLHVIVSVLLALTYPGGSGSGGDAACFFRGSASSLQGVFDEDVRPSVLVPLGLMFVFSVSNAFVWVPRTTSVMRKLHVGMFAMQYSSALKV